MDDDDEKPFMLFVVPDHYPDCKISAKYVVKNAVGVEILTRLSPHRKPPAQWLGHILAAVDKRLDHKLSKANNPRGSAIWAVSEADKGAALYQCLRRLWRNTQNSRNAIMATLKSSLKKRPKEGSDSDSSSSSEIESSDSGSSSSDESPSSESQCHAGHNSVAEALASMVRSEGDDLVEADDVALRDMVSNLPKTCCVVE